MAKKKVTLRAEDIVGYLSGMGHAIPERCRVRWGSDGVTVEWDPKEVDWSGEEGSGFVPPVRHRIEVEPEAASLGRAGGLKGGRAAAARLTAEERTQRARKAAKARWRQPG